MNRYLTIFFVILFLNVKAQENYTDTVRLNDSTFIYYFDFFNDKRVFDWDTIPKNFNFNNYRFYFRNNSEDTLWGGSVKTGDGRVTYHYAGNQRMILPNEYYIIKPFHNGDLRYRYWRFSRNANLEAIIYENNIPTTVYRNHRYLGWYSKDTILYDQPSIKLNEPNNPGPDAVETYLRDLRHQEWLRRSNARKEIHKSIQQKRIDSLERVKDSLKVIETFKIELKQDSIRAAQARIKAERLYHLELFVHITYRGKPLDSTDEVFVKRKDQLIPCKLIQREGYKPYYILKNIDTLESIDFIVKNSQGKIKFKKSAYANYGQFIISDSEGMTYNSKEEDYLKIVQKVKPIDKTKRPLVIKNYSISVFLIEDITNQCELQVLENDQWVDLPLTITSSGIGIFEYATIPNIYRVKMRWRQKGKSNWIEDWMHLDRHLHQILSDPAKINMIGVNGHHQLKFSELDFRFIYTIEKEDYLGSYSSFIDSVKRVFKWYGIPYNYINREYIGLKNKEDQARVRRALKKHFDSDIDIIPFIVRNKEKEWLCGMVLIEFQQGVSSDKALQLLIDLGFDKNLLGLTRIKLNENNRYSTYLIHQDLSNKSKLRQLEQLYQREEIFTVSMTICELAPTDLPKAH